MIRQLLKFAPVVGLTVAGFAAALLAPVLVENRSLAAERIWDGGGASDNWSTPANWDGDLTAPIGNDGITFDGVQRLTPANDLAADTVFGPLTFSAGAGSFVIGGNRITLGGNIVNDSPNAQVINLPLLLNANRTVTVNAGGQLALNGVIDGATFGLTKTGEGSLTLGANNTYTGNTILNGGTVFYTTDNANLRALNFGHTATASIPASTITSTLDLTAANVTATSFASQINSSTANTVIIGAGKALTVNGAFTVGTPVAFNDATEGVVANLDVTGENLVVNGGAGHFSVGLGRSNAATGTDAVSTLNMTTGTGLTNFTYTATTGEFRVGAGNSRATATLANVSNSITAASVRVGDSGAGGGDNNGGRSILRLGAGTNVINANTLIVGATKTGGTLEFAAAATGGTLTLAGQTGGASKVNIQIGSSSSGTGAGDESMFLLAGRNVTVQAGNVVLGRLANGTGGNSARGAVTFDTGTFNADSMQLGVNSSGSAPNGATGTFTLGGPTPDNALATGILNVSTQFLLGNRTNSNTAAGRSTATFTINGGTANINADIIDASTTVSASGANVTTLNLQGGTLNLSNHNIGTATLPITNVNLTSGTLNNPGSISGNAITFGGALNMTGNPSIVLANSGTLTSSLPALSLTGFSGSGTTTGSSTVIGNVVMLAGSRLTPGSATAVGTIQFTNDLTLTGGTGSAARFRVSQDQFTGNDQVNVSGNLNLTGLTDLEIAFSGTGPLVGNTYTLFSYGSLTGSQANLNLIAPANTRSIYSVVPTNTTPGTIQLAVTGTPALALTWIGNVNATWDLNATSNWRNPSLAADKFFVSDMVTFDNTSTNLADVSLVGQLAPGSLTVNATRNYKFAGTGSIIGGTGLTKSNTGTLVLATNNTYGGVTDIQAGTLQIGDGGTTGSVGAGNITNEGALIFNRSDSVTIANVISGSAGTVRQDGPGTLTLTGANSYAGGLTVNGGTIRLTNVASPGTGTTAVNPSGTLVVGAALTNPITLAGGTLGTSFGTTATSFTTAEVTAAAATTTTVYTADPQALATNSEVVLVGTLRGSGNIGVLSGNAATNPDGNPGFRLRGTAASDYTGTITLGHNVKGEIQTSVTGAFSPAGTGKFVLTAGDATLGNTTTAVTTTGGYSEFNVRNNSTGNTTFGNDVEIVGTGLALMNPLGSSPVNAITVMGNLKIGGGQELGVFLNTGNTHVIEFPTVTLNGGTSTFSPKTPGFGPVASVGSDIALGNVTQLVAGSGLAMSGLRTLYINGTTSYTGTTQVNSGTLGGTGTINSPLTVSAAGSLNPGYLPSPIGTLTATSVALAGTLNIDLSDSDPGIQDVLNVTNALSLTNATLKLNITGALTAPAYIISHYGSLTGGPFAAFEGTPGNYRVDYNYLNGNQIALVPAAALVQGDFNRNGALDAGDLTAMLKALTNLSLYKSQNSLSEQNLLVLGDFNTSTSVTNLDLQPLVNLLAQSNLGSIAAVPEPTGLVLGAMALVGVAFTARRRKLQQTKELF